MFALDLFNTDHERRLAEGAVDRLEQRRIDDLAMKMDDLVARAKTATTPEVKQALMKEFQKCKDERESYFKVNTECMGYGGVVGEGMSEKDQAYWSRRGQLWAKFGNVIKSVETPEQFEAAKNYARLLVDRLQDGIDGGLFAQAHDYEQNVQAIKQSLSAKAQELGIDYVEEAGIPGNVPTEKIPGKEDLLKGRGRSYYEADQKKNSEKVTEYISMSSDKNYIEAEPYKNYRIYVRKKPFGNTGMYTAHTEIDRKEFMGKGPSQEEAVQSIRDRIDFVLNAQKKVTGSSTIDFNVKFATDLLADPKQPFYAKLENVNGQPKLVIAGADIVNDPELLAAGDFKRSALRNQVDDQGRATPLPGIPLTAKSLRAGEWIANGRYTVGNETTDSDGNRVFDLTYHSTAHTKSDKLRLNQPAFTLGTAREVDESSADPKIDRLVTAAQREYPQARNSAEALAMKILNKEQDDVSRLDRVNDREDQMIDRLADLEQSLQQQIDQLKASTVDESSMSELDAMRQDSERMTDRQFQAAYGTSKAAFQQRYRTVLKPADQQDTPVDEGFQDFNKVEPYEVCLAGKPVKTFDYYEDARRFHDNWKKKLYSQGDKAKADKITLNPIMKESDKYEPAPELISLDSIPGLNHGGLPKAKTRLGQGGNVGIQAPDKTKTRGQVNNFKDRLKQKLGMDEGSFAHDQLKGEINDLFKPVVLQIVKWARAEGMTAKDLAGTSSHFFLDALDPDTYDRTQHLPDNYFNKLMDKANAKAVEILKKKGVAEADETSWTANSAQFGAGYDDVPLQKHLHDGLVAKYLPWVKKEIANGGRVDSALNSVEHALGTKDHLRNYNQVKAVIADISRAVDGPFHKEPFKEEVSGLTDAEYNQVAAYAKSKYPAMVLAALGRNPDGSVNVRMHDTKGLGITKEFKVRFRDPEETKLDEISKETLRSYLKKSKGHSQKYDQKGNKADEKGDEALANKMWNKGDNRYAGQEQARARIAGVYPGLDEMDKSQTPPGRDGDYPLGAKGTTGKPVTAKKAVKDMNKELDAAFNSPEQLKRDADYRAYRKGVKASRKEKPTPLSESGLGVGSRVFNRNQPDDSPVSRIVGIINDQQVKVKDGFTGEIVVWPIKDLVAAGRGTHLDEFAPGGIYKPPTIPTNPGKGPFEDDPRSQTVNRVQQLLDAGKSVFVLLPGAKGRAVGTQIGDDHSWLNVQYKGWKDPKTRSRSRLTVNLKADDDASLHLTPGSRFTDNKDRPFDYTLTGSAKTSGRGLFEVTVDEGATIAYIVDIANSEGDTGDVRVSAMDQQDAIHKVKAMYKDSKWPDIAVTRVRRAETVDEAETDYSKRRQREKDIDAGKPVAKQRQPRMTDYQKRRAQQKKEMELGEDQDTSGVESAIIRRIMVAHTDLLKQFGPEKVMQAAEEVAYNVGDVDEIGTSDVSAYVHQVRQILGAE